MNKLTQNVDTHISEQASSVIVQCSDTLKSHNLRYHYSHDTD